VFNLVQIWALGWPLIPDRFKYKTVGTKPVLFNFRSVRRGIVALLETDGITIHVIAL
jgi:hypothetical protein